MIERFVAVSFVCALAAPASFAAEAARTTWIVGLTPAAMAKEGAATKEIAGFPARPFRHVDAAAVEMTAEEAAALAGAAGVRYVEPDYPRYLYAKPLGKPQAGRIEIAQRAAAAVSTQQIPWGITRVGAPRLWEVARGETIRVGVVDTGVDMDHPDLREIPSGRGRTLGRPGRGYDFVNNDHDPSDDHGHGTHVAGTIAAADNLIGVVGVAPRAELYALKVLRPQPDGSATGSVANLVRAMEWAIDHDLHVLNFSLGSDQVSLAEREAVDKVLAAGILIVAASGNGFAQGITGVGYPAGYPGVIAVGAIDDTDAIAGFSQRGTGLGLVAPGVGVYSMAPRGSAFAGRVQVDGTPLFLAEEIEGSPAGRVTGPFVYCGLGKPEEFPASVAGRIALIRRGELTFNEKSRNAKAAGATAVVIFNDKDDAINFTLLRRDLAGNVLDEDRQFGFPVSVAIRRKDGEALLNKPGAILDVEVFSEDWTTLQGTSMATPHVAGAAALLWSLVPDASAAEIRAALLDGAIDLGTPGWDETFGYGLLDVWGAVGRIAPEKLPPP